MKKVKEFYKKHETKILVVGGVVLLVLAVKHRKYVKDLEKIEYYYRSHSRIIWKPTGKFITLDDCKFVLDLNAGSEEAKYAIVKEGIDYTLILLNGTKVALE